MNRLIIKRGKQFCLAAFAAITVFFCSCEKGIPDYLATSATVEIGNTFSASAFLLEEGHTAEFAPEFADLFVQDGIAKMTQIGEYSVGLLIDGKKSYTINLTVQDTIPPKASARMITIYQGDPLTVEQCVTDIKDQTKVSLSFQSEPDFTQPGLHSEIVVLTDEAGNQTELPVNITVLGIHDILAEKYTIEAGSKIPAENEMIGFNRTGKFVTDISVINTSLIGSYTLELEIDGEVYSTELVIEDTTAPTATVSPMTAYYGAAFPSANSFVSRIVDEGPVTVSYETDPGATVSGETVVRIVLTDQGGNRTVYESRCSVARDEEAPTFLTFPEALEADVDTTIIWRAMVSAEDNSGMVDVSLDTTGIDLTKPGIYTAYFVARDSVGNETRQEVKLTLHDNSVTKEMMDALCEEILGKIITEDMDTQKKVYEVYKYVRSIVSYNRDGVHDDVRREAYLGLTTRRNGDCFTFCAASQELLSYMGIESQMVKRREDLAKLSGSNHFWLLVNFGTEEEPLWYHYDATPIRKPFNRVTYMMTDAQLIAYTNYRADSSPQKLYYYTFDTSLHPASATRIVEDMNLDAKYFE